LVATFEATLPATEITLDVEGPVQTLETELRVGLYRCVQESLTNVRKHAQATKVLVRVRVDDRQAELTVLDNGSGASSPADGHEPGVGLLGMSERIALLGGVATAQAESGRGWRVEVRVPLPLAAGSDALRAVPPVSLAEAPSTADTLLSAGAER
jgi:signal transduction histidine kinase